MTYEEQLRQFQQINAAVSFMKPAHQNVNAAQDTKDYSVILQKLRDTLFHSFYYKDEKKFTQTLNKFLKEPEKDNERQYARYFCVEPHKQLLTWIVAFKRMNYDMSEVLDYFIRDNVVEPKAILRYNYQGLMEGINEALFLKGYFLNRKELNEAAWEHAKIIGIPENQDFSKIYFAQDNIVRFLKSQAKYELMFALESKLPEKPHNTKKSKL